MGYIRGNLGREGKLGIIPTLESANFALSNYFIPSTYRAGTRILQKGNFHLSNYFIESSYKDGSGKTKAINKIVRCVDRKVVRRRCPRRRKRKRRR